MEEQDHLAIKKIAEPAQKVVNYFNRQLKSWQNHTEDFKKKYGLSLEDLHSILNIIYTNKYNIYAQSVDNLQEKFKGGRFRLEDIFPPAQADKLIDRCIQENKTILGTMEIFVDQALKLLSVNSLRAAKKKMIAKSHPYSE